MAALIMRLRDRVMDWQAVRGDCLPRTSLLLYRPGIVTEVPPPAHATGAADVTKDYNRV
jgi:hypothetical protein